MTDEKKFCGKCKGILCSCGLDYSVSSSANAQRTDEKKPLTIHVKNLNADNFDLSDWFNRFVSIYPHKDSLTDSTAFIEYAAYEKLQSELLNLREINACLEQELQEKYLQAKRIANERHDSISALEREVERLKNTYEPVEGPPMTPEEDASFMAKIDDIFKSPDVQEILKEINDKRKQKEERNRKADAYDDLQTKLQAAEAALVQKSGWAPGVLEENETLRADARRLAEALDFNMTPEMHLPNPSHNKNATHAIVSYEVFDRIEKALTPEIRKKYLSD